MKLKIKSLNHNLIAVLLAMLALSFDFYLWVYYSIRDSRSSFAYEGASWWTSIRICLVMTFVGFILAEILAKNALGKFLSLCSGLAAIAIYVWWYFEKFKNMELVGTPDYYEQLKEYGVFRTATTLDYLAFYLTIILVLYSLFGLIYFLFTKKESHINKRLR